MRCRSTKALAYIEEIGRKYKKFSNGHTLFTLCYYNKIYCSIIVSSCYGKTGYQRVYDRRKLGQPGLRSTICLGTVYRDANNDCESVTSSYVSLFFQNSIWGLNIYVVIGGIPLFADALLRGSSVHVYIRLVKLDRRISLKLIIFLFGSAE